ncbi:hypothetical protein GCK72_022290 [Caenorhabditis remanei]|uniref:Phlebovirus glycoprotein G2 fusion domain-containing protein n=1 Tax=Caenorhabditis remanei TaxID=31234 RepID=A0A6A5FTG9_CAERE|nr:hypothetical protein GCK72_022290 [Caenorhabditis remanei]KAF1745843.1 hypothetical protein GCK72_022290 [Caenorhabditis remanei]
MQLFLSFLLLIICFFSFANSRQCWAFADYEYEGTLQNSDKVKMTCPGDYCMTLSEQGSDFNVYNGTCPDASVKITDCQTNGVGCQKETIGGVYVKKSTISMKKPLQITYQVALWHDVGDIIPWMAVETLLETRLIKIVTDKSNRSAQYKKSIQRSDLNGLLGFRLGEHSAVAEDINEQDCNRSVDIEDEIWFFSSGDLLDFQGVLKEWCLLSKLFLVHCKAFQDFHTLVGVVNLKIVA